MAKTLAVVAAAFATLALVSATAIPPPVPGLCTEGGTGIGCSFDATKLEAFGLTINPLASVVQWQWCNVSCYDPENWYSPPCDGCMYSLPDYPDMVYRVPQNVFVTPFTENVGCYEQSTSLQVEDYTDLIGTTVGHDGWFSSWSKTTINFYHDYYQRDDSLSLEYKMLIWHNLQVPPLVVEPTMEFTIAVQSLPETYDAQAYNDFIQQYGTHYMDNAYVGGMSLLTNYFHSCFVEQFGGQYVWEESSSSFFGIFNHNSESNNGFNKTGETWQQWSKIEMKLMGGNAASFGVLSFNHTINATQAQEWEDSIKYDMTPVKFSLSPLTALFNDATREANFNQALAEYGASISASNTALVNQLVPQDPHITPPWCSYNPHPPAYLEMSAKPRKLSSPSLPGCPALPSMPSADAIHKRLSARKSA